jgi:hypothetical protein
MQRSEIRVRARRTDPGLCRAQSRDLLVPSGLRANKATLAPSLASCRMARLARVVIPGHPHYVTQRGNAARTFFGDLDHHR